MADILYAEVNLSKKKKKRTDPKMEQEYAVLQQRYFDTEADQNQPQTSTLDTPATSTCAPATLTGIEEDKKSKTDKKQITSKPKHCVFALVVVFAVIVIVTFTCLVVLFVEVDKLKSARAPNAQLAEQLLLCNTNFSTIKDLIFDSIQTQLDEVLQLINFVKTEVHDTLFNETQRLSLLLNTSLVSFSNGIELLEIGLISNITANPCSALEPSSPSGYYWVRASNGSVVRVYCDMTRSCGGVTGGWMRVAELNMTNSCHQCPSGLREHIDSSIRTCVSSSSSPGCSSDIVFETHGISYSRVCGKIIGYQIGHTNAFAKANESTISGEYVDGVSLTHGCPRQHIWTFAAARDNLDNMNLDSKCYCIHNGTSRPPKFVGEDYFCDTVDTNNSIEEGHFYGQWPLWDGEGCREPNNCCSFRNPPWFYKQLQQPTTDDIEMRVCTNENKTNENVAIRAINIYVH